MAREDAPTTHHALERRSDEEAAELEDHLWWKVGRHDLLARYLARARREQPIRRILEIGCGSGGDLAVLAREATVVGIDPSPTLVRRARARGLAEDILEADFFELDPQDADDFDLYCLFDVLEHIEDDRAFLKRIAARAARGRLLLLSVPAGPALYGPHDELLGHHRRYRRAELLAKLDESGFDVLTSSGFVFFVYPAVALVRLRDRLLAGGQPTAPDREVELGHYPGWIGRLLTASLRLEGWLSRFVRFPFGVWVFALARRR